MSISTPSPSNIGEHPTTSNQDNSGSPSALNQPALTPTTVDLHNFLRTRRSIRRFKPDPIPDPVIQSILSTATYAPSAHNRQPWRFAVVTDSARKIRLAEAMAADFERDLRCDRVPSDKIQAQIKRSKDRITSAPVAIV